MTTKTIITNAPGADTAAASMAAQAFLRDIEHQARRREAADAARDPKRHRLTRVMADGANPSFRFFMAGKDKRGAEIRFCVSCHRNAAGLFLFWRERKTRDGFTRHDWEAFRDKRLAFSWARRCAADWRTKNSAGRLQ